MFDHPIHDQASLDDRRARARNEAALQRRQAQFVVALVLVIIATPILFAQLTSEDPNTIVVVLSMLGFVPFLTPLKVSL